VKHMPKTAKDFNSPELMAVILKCLETFRLHNITSHHMLWLVKILHFSCQVTKMRLYSPSLIQGEYTYCHWS